MPRTDAQSAAQERYNEKTYRRILLELRLDEDAEIIDDIDAAREHGITKRQWINALFYQKPSTPDNLVELSKVDSVLRAFRVENIDMILEEIKRG